MHEIIRNSFNSFAKTITRQFNVVLKFGYKCCTDGKVITLPILPLRMTEKHLALSLSHLLHECGHHLHTDFDLYAEFGKRCLSGELSLYPWYQGDFKRKLRFRSYAEVASGVLNGIEDNYMELSVEREYSGARRIFNQGFKYLVEMGHLKEPDNLANSLPLLANFAGMKLRGYDVDEYINCCIDALKAELGNSVEPICHQAVQLIINNQKNVSCTKDSVELAYHFIVLFDEFLHVDENKDSQSDSNDHKVDKKSKALTGSPDKGETCDFGQSLTAFVQDVIEGKLDDYSIADLSPVTDENADMKDIIPVSDGGQVDPQGLTIKVDSALKWVYDFNLKGVRLANNDQKQYSLIRKAMPKKVKHLENELFKMLRQDRKTGFRPANTGRLNSAKVAGVATGSTKVFKKQFIKQKSLPAVSLCIDLSASMVGIYDEAVLQLAVGFESALSNTRSRFSIYGFGDNQGNLFTRVKGFGESSSITRHRIGGLVECFGGMTPLHSLLYETSNELLAQANSRKACIIITDGVPSNPKGCNNVLRLYQSEGIEVILLCLGSSNPHWVEGTKARVYRVNTTDDLFNFTQEAFAELI